MGSDKKTINKTNTSSIKIGAYLKKLRLDNNLTQTQLADKLGIKRSTYSNYEQDIREPSLNVLSNLSKLFNIDLNIIINGYEEKISVSSNKELYDCTCNFLSAFEAYERAIGNRCFQFYQEDTKKLTELYYLITKGYIESTKAHDIAELFLSKHY